MRLFYHKGDIDDSKVDDIIEIEKGEFVRINAVVVANFPFGDRKEYGYEPFFDLRKADQQKSIDMTLDMVSGARHKSEKNVWLSLAEYTLQWFELKEKKNELSEVAQ